jgi:hypothetical protein
VTKVSFWGSTQSLGSVTVTVPQWQELAGIAIAVSERK